MLIGRSKVNSRILLDRLSEGEKQKAIAAEFRCSYSTLRRQLSRLVHDSGCKTVEEAVAQHVAGKIKLALPPALHLHVDQVMGKR